MEVVPLAIPEVLLLRPSRLEDERGAFMETYNQQRWARAGVREPFVQDNQSLSHRANVIRGLHYQMAPAAQAKLIRVLRGAIRDVVVDLRRQAPTFGKAVVLDLREGDGQQLFVPVGFAHGYRTLEPSTEVFYKVSDFYNPALERGIRWNDPALAIDWGLPESAAILNHRDQQFPLLAEAVDLF